MSDLSQMTNLRGGVIYGAARVAPTTARTWSLNLGERKGTGHPRYDITDVVMLILMDRLTGERAMAASPAALIVNALRPHLPDMISNIEREWSEKGMLRPDGGPFAVVTGRPQPGDALGWLSICFGDALLGLEDSRRGALPLIVRLRHFIALALYRLDRVQAGELDEWDEESSDGLVRILRRGRG